jgi:hypothetical protein
MVTTRTDTEISVTDQASFDYSRHGVRTKRLSEVGLEAPAASAEKQVDDN